MMLSKDRNQQKSDSLIANLAREVNRIRERCSKLLSAISNCQNIKLRQRLNSELCSLENRRKELLNAANILKEKGIYDYLSIEYLIEITKRPIEAS